MGSSCLCCYVTCAVSRGCLIAWLSWLVLCAASCAAHACGPTHGALCHTFMSFSMGICLGAPPCLLLLVCCWQKRRHAPQKGEHTRCICARHTCLVKTYNKHSCMLVCMHAHRWMRAVVGMHMYMSSRYVPMLVGRAAAGCVGCDAMHDELLALAGSCMHMRSTLCGLWATKTRRVCCLAGCSTYVCGLLLL